MSVEPSAMVRMLEIVRLRQKPGTGDEPAPGKSPTFFAFTREEAKYFGPLLAKALGAARPEQQVAFRTMDSASPTPGVTAGTLYAYGPSLYLTITHFQDVPLDGARTLEAAYTLPDSSNLARYTVEFSSETVGHAAEELPAGAPAPGKLTTLAISLEGLKTLSAKQPPQPVAKTAPPKPAPKPEKPQLAPYTSPASLPLNGATPPDPYRVKLQELQEANRLLGEKLAEQRAMTQELALLKRKLIEQRRLVQQLKDAPRKKAR